MSAVLQSGIEVLARAESDLRGLLGEAAAAADYDSLLVLADWARRLGNMVAESSGAGNRRARSEGGTAKPAQNRQAAASARAKRPPRKKRGRVRTRASSTSSEFPEFPKFLRDGDNLVKIGWSRSEKTTYEHKAPRRAIDLLVKALTRCGDRGRRFTMEEALPLVDPADGTEIPAYQAYVCLAWLRKEGLVEQHGRQGYSMPAAAHMDSVATKRFEDLAQR